MAEKPKLDDEFLKSRGMLVYTQSKSGQTYANERWRKDADMYNGKFSEKQRKYSEYLGTQRLFINKTYSNTQRILVDVVDSFFSDPDEIVSVRPQKNVDKTYTDAVKALLNYRLNSHPIDIYPEIYEMGMDGIKTGICVVKVFPRLKTEKREKDNDFIPEEGSPDVFLDDDEVVTAYEPELTTVPPEDVYFSQRATWKDYWKYPIVHRYRKTRDWLKRNGFKNYNDVPSVQDITLGEQIKTQRFESSQDPFTQKEEITPNQEVLVYEYWDFLPVDDAEEVIPVSYYLLGNEQGPMVVGKDFEENKLPYKFGDFDFARPPIILGTAFPESHQLKGKSFPEITESLQYEINAIANQEREAVARALRPDRYVNREANVDLMSLVNRRIGGYTQGDGPPGNAIQELPTQNPMGISPAHRARVDQDYAENSGIPPNLLGISSREETATAATQQLTNANKKIKLILTNLAYTAIVPAFKYLLRLEQTYSSDEFVNNVTGRVLGWTLPADEFPATEVIQGDFDINVNLGESKQIQMNRLNLLADKINQANQVMAQLVQLGIVDPSQVKFKDPMKAFNSFLPTIGLKNVEEWDIQAQAPPPQEGQQQQLPGVASQPAQPGGAGPQGDALNVIG